LRLSRRGEKKRGRRARRLSVSGMRREIVYGTETETHETVIVIVTVTAIVTEIGIGVIGLEIGTGTAMIGIEDMTTTLSTNIREIRGSRETHESQSRNQSFQRKRLNVLNKKLWMTS